jgi:hypothetical protein
MVIGDAIRRNLGGAMRVLTVFLWLIKSLTKPFVGLMRYSTLVFSLISKLVGTENDWRSGAYQQYGF